MEELSSDFCQTAAWLCVAQAKFIISELPLILDSGRSSAVLLLYALLYAVNLVEDSMCCSIFGQKKGHLTLSRMADEFLDDMKFDAELEGNLVWKLSAFLWTKRV